jgi:hypothetical protein
VTAAGRNRPTPHLFPGRQPGQPVTAKTLTRRLTARGIPSMSTARSGALLSLTGAIHWKMLADLLGLADNTALQWHKTNGDDRASYLATRLRVEDTTPAEPE